MIWYYLLIFDNTEIGFMYLNAYFLKRNDIYREFFG